MSNLRNGTKVGFEHGLTSLIVLRSSTELPRSTSSVPMSEALALKRGTFGIEKLTCVILYLRFQLSIPVDTQVIDELIVVTLTFVIDRRYTICIADSYIRPDEVYTSNVLQ